MLLALVCTLAIHPRFKLLFFAEAGSLLHALETFLNFQIGDIPMQSVREKGSATRPVVFQV